MNRRKSRTLHFQYNKSFHIDGAGTHRDVNLCPNYDLQCKFNRIRFWTWHAYAWQMISIIPALVKNSRRAVILTYDDSTIEWVALVFAALIKWKKHKSLHIFWRIIWLGQQIHEATALSNHFNEGRRQQNRSRMARGYLHFEAIILHFLFKSASCLHGKNY